MSLGTLLIRADANTAIGIGHVMRSLALAHAWQDAGGRAAFAMAEGTPSLQARVAAECCDVLPVSAAVGTRDDLLQTVALAQERNCEWVVVDGYRFRAEYQQGLKAANFKVLFLDDWGHSECYSADLVLNQNAAATSVLYSNREPQTELLLGPRYAMLRREFSVWRDWKRVIQPECNHLLIMMGGGDEGNVTATVIEGLRVLEEPQLETTVIVGTLNPHFAALQDQALRSGLRIRFLTDVSNVGQLMADADLAVSAAGSTCWELCLLGLPVLLIDVADNQTEVAKELDNRGCAIHLGDRNITPEMVAERMRSVIDGPTLRQSLSCRSREVVDGWGAARVASILRGKEALRLRPVRFEDRRLLWEWANEPEVRTSSFSPDPIPWETHAAWFEQKLQSSRNNALKSLIFIAEDEETNAVGQVRFDSRTDGEWEVGVSLDKKMRGRGLGNELIAVGIRKFLKQTKMARVHAYVKPANVASVKSFERAGFRRAGMKRVGGIAAIHLIYD